MAVTYAIGPFATGGMIGAAVSFVLLALLPTNFPYPLFALVLVPNGISMGLCASPTARQR